MSAISLAEVLSRARQRMNGGDGASLRDVAEAAGIGHSYLARLERGRVRDPSPHTLRALAPVLGVPYTTLMRKAGYL